MRRTKHDHGNLFGTVLIYEIKKIVLNRFTVITLIILTGYSLIQGVFQAEQMGDYAARTRDLRRAIDGREIDDELLAEMVAAADEYGVFWNESNCTYEGIAGWVRSIVGYGRPLSDYNADAVYQARLVLFRSSLTDAEKAYWYDQEEELKKPIVLHSHDEAQGLNDIILSIPLIMLFVITLFLSQIFAGEVRDRTDPLLRCTQGGWSATYWAKITAAVIVTLCLAVFTSFVSIVTSLVLWGNNGWDAAVQNVLPMVARPMTIGGFVVIQITVALASSILLSVITCFLSECLNNPVAVMTSVFGGFLAILAGVRMVPYNIRPISQILYLLSPMDMDSVTVLYEYRLIGWDGHFLTAWQFVPILYMTIAVVLIVVGRFVYMKRN